MSNRGIKARGSFGLLALFIQRSSPFRKRTNYVLLKFQSYFHVYEFSPLHNFSHLFSFQNRKYQQLPWFSKPSNLLKIVYFQGRGHNLAAFRMNGEFISKTKFDTYGNPAAGANMSDYINNLPSNTIVIVTVNDSGQNYVTDAHQALLSIGAQPPLTPNGLRASWCLIGHKGGYRPWIAQDQKDRYDVVAKVSAKIYLEQWTLFVLVANAWQLV